ncbi:MAG: hypothetical protein WC602_06685 [archaeon]
MNKKIPKIIREVGFDFWWSNRKVRKLDYPPEKMNISELEWHFDIPFWNTKGGRYDLSPNEVMKFPEKHREEYGRAMKSDLRHPLDIMKNKGRWLMLDGLHRLVKCKILGCKKVRVRKIPRSGIKGALKK